MKCFIIMLVAVFCVGGCGLKSMVSNGPATPADCASIRAYIELCSTEAVKASLPEKTRMWYELAIAGAQIELARKCAGVQ